MIAETRLIPLPYMKSHTELNTISTTPLGNFSYLWLIAFYSYLIVLWRNGILVTTPGLISNFNSDLLFSNWGE